ncbi:MAG: hypothetical protein GF313_03260 [Caldithrix sp.]|nr:hypothetical protein [Caldithrix sp.]
MRSKLSAKLKNSISDFMEIDGNLLKHLSFLLQDMWVLGSDSAATLEAIQSTNLPKNRTVVLDLGCGKGAVLI